ncbi:hypothetical protein METHB2_40066 [Candidatus Methylobacter favarea]|uniref:Uncharacterized protein n=1 Tax=Candidatus Methylobacter favarea TaxID=2707345 RepID=A0A8S0WJJ5_9GAMM|nr:hypothetical protein [Candidatus Methylobacter favarea]CAA9891366.1 hypothetical protein METHB2_40066 [Candidatus Methylobacter favarea]
MADLIGSKNQPGRVCVFYNRQREFDPVSFDSNLAAAKDLIVDTSFENPGTWLLTPIVFILPASVTNAGSNGA